MRVDRLIKLLRTKDARKEVEFIVVGTDGEIVCMSVEQKVSDIVKMLNLFKQGD